MIVSCDHLGKRQRVPGLGIAESLSAAKARRKEHLVQSTDFKLVAALSVNCFTFPKVDHSPICLFTRFRAHEGRRAVSCSF